MCWLERGFKGARSPALLAAQVAVEAAANKISVLKQRLWRLRSAVLAQIANAA